MRKLTWTTEEKKEYVAEKLKRYYEFLVSLSELKFEGVYTTKIDCNSKYDLDVIVSAVDTKAYSTYELGLTLYKKENGVAQHSIRLTLDNPKMFRGYMYQGYSTPCFRGKLQTNQSIQFMRDYSDLSDSRKLVIEGIQKEELLSAYFDVIPKLTDFVNSVHIKAEYPHLKVAGLEDD